MRTHRRSELRPCSREAGRLLRDHLVGGRLAARRRPELPVELGEYLLVGHLGEARVVLFIEQLLGVAPGTRRVLLCRVGHGTLPSLAVALVGCGFPGLVFRVAEGVARTGATGAVGAGAATHADAFERPVQ